MYCVFFFFFKQKTAYEIMPSLVGSEMCIRDRYQRRVHGIRNRFVRVNGNEGNDCMLYLHSGHAGFYLAGGRCRFGSECHKRERRLERDGKYLPECYRERLLEYD
eukprot:TRINITY_DN1638_c0_g1_i2.p3 TRINITY_DN1638_c0_g1~~TRINITY_DN1638_c0_g1_i2.p3  ORF type:complete len:105 (-),score=11.92 TRINITY_DN1638_c0_g1_i2:518-832(-)